MKKILRVLLLGTIALFLGLQIVMAGTGTTRTDTAHFYIKHDYDVLKYKLDIDLYSCYFAPYARSFNAALTISIRIDSALNLIRLNAINSSIEIDSVTMAGISFIHTNDTLTIALDRIYLHGETLSLTIFYKHKDVVDHAFYTGYGYLFTDAPPEGARKWFPCWDRPSDKAKWELTAKVPLSVRLGSNGYLADSVINTDTLIYHWISENPVATYLISISSKMNWQVYTEYWHKFSNPLDSLPVRLYHKPGEAIGTVINTIGPMTNLFSQRFGDYPFEKIGFATLNGSFPWGGMENQSLVNIQQGGYNDPNLISHEHSHQWFGDLITCGTWADIWLNEGFGTYCQNLWVEYSEGYDAYKNSMNAVANYYLSVNPGWPLYHPQWAIHTPSGNELYNQAITYNKGACVLHQLRYVLGDSLFFSVLHSYATDTCFMFKNTLTETFISKMNDAAGKDLNWFFNEWVYRPNHPIYENTFEIISLGASTWKVNLLINQVQTNSCFFKMPLQFGITFSDGTDTLVQIMNDINHQFIEFNFGKQPENVTFDPFRNILLKQATTVVGIKNHGKSTGFRLQQNEPNPFHGFTSGAFEVSQKENVTISVTDVYGNIIQIPVHGLFEPGNYRFDIQSVSLLPGVYFLTMKAGDFRDTKKMIAIR